MRKRGMRNLHRSSDDDGWSVKISRRCVLHRKFFGDRFYGSSRAALAAARKYRNHLLAQLPVLPNVRFSNPNNRTGVVGVARCTRRKTLGRTEVFYVANWADPITGIRKQRGFSVATYGKRKALELASEARARAIGR
jgi:hypothetical protein